MTKAQPKLPKRSSRFGIGKDIGGAVYVHRDYETILGAFVSGAKEQLPKTFVYEVGRNGEQVIDGRRQPALSQESTLCLR